MELICLNISTVRLKLYKVSKYKTFFFQYAKKIVFLRPNTNFTLYLWGKGCIFIYLYKTKKKKQKKNDMLSAKCRYWNGDIR